MCTPQPALCNAWGSRSRRVGAERWLVVFSHIPGLEEEMGMSMECRPLGRACHGMFKHCFVLLCSPCTSVWMAATATPAGVRSRVQVLGGKSGGWRREGSVTCAGRAVAGRAGADASVKVTC